MSASGCFLRPAWSTHGGKVPGPIVTPPRLMGFLAGVESWVRGCPHFRRHDQGREARPAFGIANGAATPAVFAARRGRETAGDGPAEERRKPRG